MASYIKTLKEDNGDITYPQTLASAVYTSGGSDVETEMAKYVTAEEIASTASIQPWVSTGMINDNAVTAAKLASNSVTTAKIADGSVTADKIDWSSFPCVETTFMFRDKADQSYVDVTTNKGTQLRIAFLNGCVPYIISGATGINIIEVKSAAKFSSGLTAGYSIAGVGSGAVIYTRKHVQYPNSGTVSTGEQNTSQSWSSSIGGVTVYGGDFSSVGSGAKASLFTDYTVIKYDTSNTSINGTLGTGGSLTSLQFEAQVSSVPADVMPGIFQGGSSSYFVGGFCYIKIIEDAS